MTANLITPMEAKKISSGFDYIAVYQAALNMAITKEAEKGKNCARIVVAFDHAAGLKQKLITFGYDVTIIPNTDGGHPQLEVDWSRAPTYPVSSMRDLD